MVEEIKQIIARFPKQNKTDLEFLIAYARNNPDEELPFLLLQNYPPDLFNSDLWVKSDSLAKQFKSIAQYKSSSSNIVFEDTVVEKDASLSEQKTIIDAFLGIKIPDFL